MKKKKLPLWASLILVVLALVLGVLPDNDGVVSAQPPVTSIQEDIPETPLPPDTTPADPAPGTLPAESTAALLDFDGSYTTKEDVALYIHLYGQLPGNFLTKKEARELGWEGGSLEPYAPGMCIGGDRFGNYEGLLPNADGRIWTECDIGTPGATKRGAERIVFSNDGLIYYTADHYEHFEMLYGGD